MEIKQIRAVLKRMRPPEHLAPIYTQDNFLYNNRAFSYFSLLICLLFFSGALAMGLFAAIPRVTLAAPLRAAYLTCMGASLLFAAALTLIRRKPALLRLTTAVTVAECTLFVAMLMLTVHIEIPSIGFMRIETLMIALFSLVFLARYPLPLTLGLQTAYTLAFVIQLWFERPLISNFLPCLTNLLVTYVICAVAACVYYASRLNSFIARKNLESLVTMDFLTNVHNRRGFDYALRVSHENALASRSRLSLFILDIDDFKRYNDHYGHPQGDACLVAVAEVIAESVRKADFVARYGGEEFAVILMGTPRHAAEQIARRMFGEMERIALPHATGPYPFVTFSIGCMSSAPAADGLSPEDVLRKADEALYTAKARGKNRLVFHPDSL